MNKKIFMLGIPLLVLVLVSAIMLVSYGEVEQEIEVRSPIEIISSTDTIIAWLGQETTPTKGAPITIENIANIGAIEVEVSNNAPDGITVSYLAKLELFNKDTETWTEIGDASEILYTIIGQDFVVENNNDGTMVINYIEPSDPYTGAFNLPTEITSSFTDEKFWLVPEDVDADENNVLDTWTPEEFKFEHELISYTQGDSGVIIIPQGVTIELIPVYSIIASIKGTTTVTTTINNVA